MSDSAPEISATFRSATAVITEQVANPLVGFADASIEASTNDGMYYGNVILFYWCVTFQLLLTTMCS